ncbi:probable ATP-dependent RNA helicase CG8611 [Bicyclus anynana]|uniref:ATP-dependent RNA helicase n=1 Tax=Bicyclus anynana TaxID=110368 RepID=A0ABM3LDH4_BICAN|nr:probable ATP-dependent RNA helicase CG8611 [Bicyclus anynana]
MDDLQLNIVSHIKKKPPKKPKNQQPLPGTTSGYKFKPKPDFSGKIIARKRPQNTGPNKFPVKRVEEPQNKVPRLSQPSLSKDSLDSTLRDLSENKGKFHGKNYQEINDELQINQKPRSGPWISSLFKNNPDVPKLGQKAVKPLIEKVFAGKTFSNLNIHPHSVANLEKNLNLKELMTVQQKAIPIILEGRDTLIRSQTGSGKTLAYALPVIEALQAIRPKINRHDGVRVIVVVPTRELAVQTFDLFVKLVKPFIWIVPGLLSGGTKRKAEKSRLRKGLSILVGTPGRINDHLRHTHSLNFSKTGCLILDEADRLLDMGYEKDVAAIVKAIEDHKKAATYDPIALVKQTFNTQKLDNSGNKDQEIDDAGPQQESTNVYPLTKVFLSTERQTILLSATLTKAVENLAGITMQDPVFVDTSDGKTVVADSIKQNKPIENVQPNGESPMKTITKQNVSSELKETSNSKKEIVNNADDDSDSDYEYFKVQKELDTKNIDVKKNEDENTNEEKHINESKNTFVQAIKTAIGEDELVLPATVNQTFLIVPMKLRLVTLCSLIIEHCVLNKAQHGKMIVFMGTHEMVDFHTELIEKVLTGKNGRSKKINKKYKEKKKSENMDSEDSESELEVDYEGSVEGGVVPQELDVFSLHGNMDHEKRVLTFKQFCAAKKGLLFCTDVAARGLDVHKVDLVLQYCTPASATDYVHRVGRTGRAAQVGAAVLLLLPSETEFVRHLEQKRIRLRQSDESQALDALRSVVPTAPTRQRAAIALQAKLEYTVHSSKEWLTMASRAFTSWVRFYSGCPREAREWMDARQLHLGHAAKAFALRETPAAVARRARSDPKLQKDRPNNRLTVHDEEEKKRPGFPKMKVGVFAHKIVNKQSSMHTASEFDSGLPPVDTYTRKIKKNK